MSFSGDGASVTDTFSTTPSLTAFVATHNGESNFIVEAVPAEGGDSVLIFNEIGEFSGAIAAPSRQEDWQLDIDADGSWSIIVAEPLSTRPDTRRPPVSASGSGNQLVGPISIEGSTTVAGSHSGDGNFIVELFDEYADQASDGELLFNELDDFEGETIVSGEYWGWVNVDADGEWTLEFE